MAYEQRDNSGSMFINEHRQGENHPNVKGKAMVGGKMYWVSAWTKTTRDGKKWQSLAFQEMDEQQGSPQGTAAPPADFDDDLPF